MELFEKILGQEGEDRVLGGAYLVGQVASIRMVRVLKNVRTC